MSTQELSSLRVHTIGQYQAAGKALVQAYRSAGHRLIDNNLTRQMGADKLSRFLAERLDADTERAVALLDRIADDNRKGIEALADRAAQLEQPALVKLLDRVTASQLPLAKVSAKIADTLADGAQQIAARAAAAADGAAAADADSEADADVAPSKPARAARAARKAA